MKLTRCELCGIDMDMGHTSGHVLSPCKCVDHNYEKNDLGPLDAP